MFSVKCVHLNMKDLIPKYTGTIPIWSLQSHHGIESPPSGHMMRGPYNGHEYVTLKTHGYTIFCFTLKISLCTLNSYLCAVSWTYRNNGLVCQMFRINWIGLLVLPVMWSGKSGLAQNSQTGPLKRNGYQTRQWFYTFHTPSYIRVFLKLDATSSNKNFHYIESLIPWSFSHSCYLVVLWFLVNTQDRPVFTDTQNTFTVRFRNPQRSEKCGQYHVKTCSCIVPQVSWSTKWGNVY